MEGRGGETAARCAGASSGLRLQRGGVSAALVVFAFHLHALVSHPPLLATLVHIVGPLRAGAAAPACPLAVHKAPPAGGEGSAASAAVVHPGFLPVPIIVLGNKRDVGVNVQQSGPILTLTRVLRGVVDTTAL